MLLDILLLLVGFLILILGADKLVDGGSSLAAKLGIPNIVIGMTIVAFGSSSPELVVNVIAALEGSSEMVLGNVIGSNIFNVVAILVISALIFPLTVKSSTTWLEIPMSLLAAVGVLILAGDVFLDGTLENVISRSEGLVLLLFFSIFLVYNLSVAKKSQGDDHTDTPSYSNLKSILFILLGLGGLILGGRLIVDSAVAIAEVIGLSERIIGLTVVSVGTSLPELATSIVAVRKRNVDIAIGNVVGSNIFNIFLILGVSTVVTPVVVAENAFFDLFVNILASFLLFLFVFTGKGRKVDRWEGLIFVLIYVAYVTYLVI